MPSKIICYHRNGLGNFIEFTPAMRALASLDPSSKVDICIDSAWQDNRREAFISIASNLPFVEEIINYPAIPFNKDYKTWYWTRHTYPSEALNLFKIKDPRFDVGFEWMNSQMHEIEFYMGLVRRFLGFSGETPKQFVPVTEVLPPSNKKKITLCNGSYGHLRSVKAWPGFPDLAETIKRYYGDECEIIKIGYEKELSDVACFDVDLVGRSILSAINAVAACDLLVTTDTCMMHVGDALCKPMVVVWGGTIITKNQPVNGTAVIVRKDFKCQPCQESARAQTCLSVPCLNHITVGDVMSEVRRKLNGN